MKINPNTIVTIFQIISEVTPLLLKEKKNQESAVITAQKLNIPVEEILLIILKHIKKNG